MGTKVDYRENSRKGWFNDQDNMKDHESIQLGAILRIADATEAMAKNYQELIRERDNFKRWNQQNRDEVKTLKAQNIALKGWITRLKKQRNNKQI